MRFWQITALSAMFGLTSPALASTAQAGSITSLHGMSNGAVLFSSSGTRTAPPSCGSNFGLRWALDASTLKGQSQLSLLLTAYALHKQVIVIGTGACSIWGDTETVDFFMIVD